MMNMPCKCMVIEQADGSSMCRTCRGDWYGCDCPQKHAPTCSLKWDARCVCGQDRREHFRVSAAHGGMKPIPTPGGGCHGVDFEEDIGPEYEGPTCSLCDAPGHGYPGAGPCPLEQRGEDARHEPWWAQ